jgi:hypothetical protein
VILIEFCAIADAGVVACDRFPDASGDLFSAGTFCGCVDMANAFAAAFPSNRSEDEDNVPQELPSPN